MRPSFCRQVCCAQDGVLQVSGPPRAFRRPGAPWARFAPNALQGAGAGQPLPPPTGTSGVRLWAPEGEQPRAHPGKALASRRPSSCGGQADPGTVHWGLVLPSNQDWGLRSLSGSQGGEGNQGLSSGLRTQPRRSWLNNCSAQPAYVGLGFVVWVGGALCSPAAGIFTPLGEVPTVNTFTCCSQNTLEGTRESRPGIEPDLIMSPG